MAGKQTKALIAGSVDVSNAGIVAGILVLTLPFPCYKIRVVNNSNTLVSVSYGYQDQTGTAVNDYVRAASDMEVITQTNALPPNLINLWPVGTTIKIAASADTGAGFVYVTGYYQEN